MTDEKQTDLDIARRLLEEHGEQFTAEVETYHDQCAAAETSDCLHCELWKVINRYCRENPDGCVQNMIDGVVDVIADMLVLRAGAQCEELWQHTRERMRERMRKGHENRRVRR
jgi:hypothetical protein